MGLRWGEEARARDTWRSRARVIIASAEVECVSMDSAASSPEVSEIARWVDEAVASTAVYDLHTHLYPVNFGRLNLWGVDELLNYHYLIAETMRLAEVSYEAFWGMAKEGQNELIWRTLFVEH